MTAEEIEQIAKKRVADKKVYYLIALICAAASVILAILSLNFPWHVAFWLLVPIPVMAAVLGLIYVILFGVPGMKWLNREWEEQEISREIRRLHGAQRSDVLPDADLSEEDRLELKELERLKRKWEDPEDYV